MTGKLHNEISHGDINKKSVEPITTDILIKGLYDKEKASAENIHDIVLNKLTKIKNLETLQEVINQLYVQLNLAQTMEYQLYRAIGSAFNGMKFYNQDKSWKEGETTQTAQYNLSSKIGQHLKGFIV